MLPLGAGRVGEGEPAGDRKDRQAPGQENIGKGGRREVGRKENDEGVNGQRVKREKWTA